MITTSGQEFSNFPGDTYLAGTTAESAIERLAEQAVNTCLRPRSSPGADSAVYRAERMLLPWRDLLSRLADGEIYCLRRDTGAVAALSTADQSTVTVADMVTRIQRVLGLGVAQVAQCIGVSRPALYKHINNDAPRDIEAYYRLYEFALRVEDEVGSLGKLQKTVLIEGKSFVRHLCERPDDHDFLLDAARRVATVLAGRSAPKPASLSEQRLASRSISKSG